MQTFIPKIAFWTSKNLVSDPQWSWNPRVGITVLG